MGAQLAGDHADLHTISHLQDLADRAWPATLIEDLDGWELRWSRGSSNRTNSVKPRRHRGEVSLSNKLAAVEAFYRQRGLPSLYQISPVSEPRDLDSILENRGYLRYDDSLFQIASLADLRALTGMPMNARVVTSTALSKRWCEQWVDFSQTGESSASDMLEILGHVAVPTVFVELEVGGKAVAVGRGVCEVPWLGIFNMATSVLVRGRGAGAAVLGAIGRWGDGLQATHSYLQVDADNEPALRLYHRASFTNHHPYWYRIRY